MKPSHAALLNLMLAIIAILLACIVWLLVEQQPITRQMLEDALKANDEDRYVALLERIPLVRITNQTLDVEIQNSELEVNVTNPYLTVEIDR